MSTPVETPPGPAPQPAVLTLRIRIRTLCIAVGVVLLVFAVATALFAWQLYKSTRVTGAIQARGGYVYTNYYSGNLPRTWAPWTGSRGRGTYTEITLDNCNVTDQWLAAHDLSRLSGHLTVSLSGNSITDEGLRHVARYRRLNHLVLADTQITDAGLAHLKDCRDLSGVSLNDTAVTDAGLAHLDGIPQLNYLHLNDTRVTDAGILRALETLTLTTLSLDASIVTPELVAAMDSEPIYSLVLYGVGIPQALPLLAGTTGIKSLSLDGDSVTDDCIPDLSALTGVTYLQLTNTRVTRGGYDQLREALPGCTIYVWLNWEGETE